MANRVGVLMFHRVVGNGHKQHDISPETFGDLLAFLSSNQLLRADPDLGAITTTHQNGCVLTFDDATEDHLAVAQQLTRESVRGVFYVSTGKVGESGYLTAGQVVSLAEMGHVIGSHCVTHETADRLTEREFALELETSKAYLEDLLGRSVDALALPGGVTTKAAPLLARQAGYSYLRLTRWGIYSSEQQQWRVPCVPITRFTMGRGWVTKAARDLRLPPDMALMGRAKDLLPATMAEKARNLLHRVPGPRA